MINCINNAGYNLLIQLASSLCLIPYFLCAAFGLKTATRPGTQAGAFLVTSAVATLRRLVDLRRRPELPC